MKKPCNMDRNVADLLISSQFLKPSDLDRALAACRDHGQPLARMLLDQKVIGPNLLVAAIEVAVAVKDKRLTPAAGTDVLHLMGHYDLSLEEAIEKMGAQPVRSPWISSLDRLSAYTDAAPPNS